MSTAKIAVMGFGVVGSGTVELFYRNKDIIEKRSGTSIDIKYILDLRDFPDSPYRDKFTKSFDDILNDPEVTVAAELMGGKTFAYDYTKRLLSRGKSVVTSNKELVATHGAELLRIAKENGCNYLFEASVGGGIPIIRPLHKCLAANRFEKISGILNGTTNYILTKMIYEQMSFDEALAQAQALGYAEKDPTADVDGHDATRKLCIIGSLAFGRHIYPEYVHCSGIRKITLDDVEYAENAGYAIKLIGLIENTESGLVATVCPRLVSVNNPLSGVNDVFNAMMDKFNYKNPMEVPKLEKITINIGLGEAKDNAKLMETAVEELAVISGQKPVITKAKKSIANFKVRQGMPVGTKVTLRGENMYVFADKFFNIALPRVRDFKGVSKNSFDGRGNYSMGIKEQLIFPEINYDKVDLIKGMNIVFTTTAKTDEEALELLRLLGMPFEK